MKPTVHPLLFLLATLPLPSLAASADTDNAQLRQQIEQLQTQLRAAQAQCPAAAATPEKNEAVVAKPMSPPPTASEPAAAPAGYKLVKVDPHEEPPLPKDDRWREPDNWDALHRGMSFAEVEQLLGIEHRVSGAKDRVQWTYGKVGPNPASRLIFVDDTLAVWERPNF